MSPPINDPRHPWTRLTAAARSVPLHAEEAAPYGFSTRVAALAFAQDRPGSALFEHFALRAVGCATLLAAFSVMLNYEAISTPSAVTTAAVEVAELGSADDAVAIVLDLALAD